MKPNTMNSGSCDLCKGDLDKGIGTTFVDGKTTAGPWADMCESCFATYGVGTGTGKGQRYNAHAHVGQGLMKITYYRVILPDGNFKTFAEDTTFRRHVKLVAAEHGGLNGWLVDRIEASYDTATVFVR